MQEGKNNFETLSFEKAHAWRICSLIFSEPQNRQRGLGHGIFVQGIRDVTLRKNMMTISILKSFWTFAGVYVGVTLCVKVFFFWSMKIPHHKK